MLTENTENSEITDQSFIFKTEFFTELFIKFFNENNKKIFDSPDLMSESVRDKAEAKKNVMKISSSWKEMSIMRHERLKKRWHLWTEWFYQSKFLNEKNLLIEDLNC